MKKRITILTPTYNRSRSLQLIYQSLQNQKANFNWLIIDDGSKDRTEELVKKWIEEKKIAITYIKQKNQGKYIAINRAIEECETPYMLCLDSDDVLTQDAIAILDDFINKYMQENVWGIVGPRKYENGTIHPSWKLKEDGERMKMIELYEKKGYQGETYILWNMKYVKKHKFPTLYKEKFMPEGVLYDALDERYDILINTKPIYLFEYQKDGYTKNAIKILMDNPNNYAYANYMVAKNQMHCKKVRWLSLARYYAMVELFNLLHLEESNFPNIDKILAKQMGKIIKIRYQRKIRKWRKDENHIQ